MMIGLKITNYLTHFQKTSGHSVYTSERPKYYIFIYLEIKILLSETKFSKQRFRSISSFNWSLLISVKVNSGLQNISPFIAIQIIRSYISVFSKGREL